MQLDNNFKDLQLRTKTLATLYFRILTIKVMELKKRFHLQFFYFEYMKQICMNLDLSLSTDKITRIVDNTTHNS